jgi:hypothetical protein
MKKISRIHSVQFHNIDPEESLGKIVSFKIEQNMLKKGMVIVSEIVSLMSTFNEN